MQILKDPSDNVIHSSTVLPLVPDDLGKLLILAIYTRGTLDKYILSGSYYYRSTSNDTRVMLFATGRRLICVFGALEQVDFLIEGTNGDAVITHKGFTFLFNTLTLKPPSESVKFNFWDNFFYRCHLTNKLSHVRQISNDVVQSWHIVTPPANWNYITSTIYPKDIKVEGIISLVTINDGEEFQIKDFVEDKSSIIISPNNRLQSVIVRSSNLFIGIILPPNMNYTINIPVGMIYASNGNTFYIPKGLFSDTYIRYYTNSPWGYEISFDKDLNQVIIFTKDKMKFGGSTTKSVDGSSTSDVKPIEQPPSGESSAPHIKPIEQPPSGESSAPHIKPIEQPPSGESSAPHIKPIEQPPSGESSTPHIKPIEQPPSDESSAPHIKPNEPSKLSNQKNQSLKSLLYSLWGRFRMLFM
ncbi:uncharacterized protein CMU_022540 [Cryptosporidium muris RN66]|uniref:Uncharacterized protein n=1 Tax=Cryptosporidium muris (strain RN66) TaxID=441375 RepID=B6AK77_CRYMR|nr:uncharacterized protein CMU_022540 [Cryptosporidium muris RN66]EEA08618.1 hypothetical protein CMU_022540 [Cryptosporidium muris RN66]|eukprot:XP_002142967.1 hypothetical protein [Cryptosporidium muris RN66]